MKASVVLLTYNRWNLTHARMWELHQYAPIDTEIIILDNASTDDDVTPGARFWAKEMNLKHDIRYIRTQKNLGFGGGHNYGAQKATGDFLIFLSNDVRISGDFISQINAVLEENPISLVGGRMIDWPSGWNSFRKDKETFIIPYLEGWMLSCKMEIWKDLGGFDPIFEKFDYEDVDLSYTAKQAGIELVALNSSFLDHIGAGTIGFSKEREKITIRNRERFARKWGLDVA